jgi:hypothetical protein
MAWVSSIPRTDVKSRTFESTTPTLFGRQTTKSQSAQSSPNPANFPRPIFDNKTRNNWWVSFCCRRLVIAFLAQTEESGDGWARQDQENRQTRSVMPDAVSDNPIHTPVRLSAFSHGAG